MRLVRIFSIYFEDALQYRSTAFVWFLLALFNPLMVLLFWRGAFASGSTPLEGWTYPALASYYLLLVVANTLLISHIENDIARRDIQMGMLSNYLTKPFSYVIHKFFNELPWRLMQGSFALGTLLFFVYVLRVNLRISEELPVLLLALIITALAHTLGFLFKMVLGLSAFWITDYSGLMELSDVVTVIFSGSVMPLVLFPGLWRTIAMGTPFAYIIYYPVISFLGKLTLPELARVIAGELFWIAFFFMCYRAMWTRGIKKFSGIGR